jgi:hypothetical protein
MANPPPAKHSDIDGVNRDARAGKAPGSSQADPGSALEHARTQSKGRPKGSAPLS